MSGSKGYYSNSREPEKLFQKIKADQEKVKNDVYDTEVSDLINDTLSSIDQRNRDTDKIDAHLDTIKSALESEIEGTIDLKYGGSLAKRTFVEGFSDIDMIVLVNKSDLRDFSPEEVKTYIFDRLRERLPNTDVEKGSTVITINYSDYQIQLLPALKDRQDYKVADPTDQKWMQIQPNKFSGKLTRVNQAHLNKLIPTIKMIKLMLNQLPEQRRISGYHVESLAIDIFKDYNGKDTTPEMIKHFFKVAPLKVLSPIKDSTGHKIHVDDKLGSDNSLARKIIGDAISRISKKIESADLFKDVSGWDELINS